jgi:glyoxylase I family protein
MAIHVEGMAPYIEVFDMPVSLKFYREILGFKITGSSGEGDDVNWIMMQLNDVTLMLNTAYEKTNRPPTPDKMRTTGHADITFYFGCRDIDSLYTYLLEKGIELKKPKVTKYGWKAIYLTDPDGYKLCFHWPLSEL